MGSLAALWSSKRVFMGFLIVFLSSFVIKEACNSPVCNK